jgi:hypothetical protein
VPNEARQENDFRPVVEFDSISFERGPERGPSALLLPGALALGEGLNSWQAATYSKNSLVAVFNKWAKAQ